MSHWRAWLVATLGVATLAGCTKQAAAPAPAPPPLSKQGLSLSSWKSASPDLHDRLLLAHAVAKGDTEAMVMVATQVGSAGKVATAIAALGGDIQARFDDVGYLRVRLSLDRLAEINALPDVLMAHLDGGGAHGSYANDRDLVSYLAAQPAPRPAPRVSSDAQLAADTTDVTDTLLGGDIESASALSAEIEALLRAAADPNIEVLTQAYGGGRFPGGGEDVLALMANRAVEVHGKPMFNSAGEAGRRVLTVGEYTDAVAADGGGRLDLLAPGAAPQAASATATLIAAARAENLAADARHISWALRMGAQRLEQYQSHEQGFGLIDVTATMELLRQQRAKQLDLPDIQTRAPVKTYLARFLPAPGVGQGLYEREGWLIRQKDTRKVTLLRQSGPATPLTYSLQWRGNDGTFTTTQEEVTLPFNEPVDVQLEISPAQIGIHSAHLYLIDKPSGLPVHAVMATIIASEQFTAANGYTIQLREQNLQAKRPTSYFLEVPPNISSLRLDTSVGVGHVQFTLAGGVLDILPSRVISPTQPAVLLVPYPPPGVYELVVTPRGTSTDVQIAASIRYVDSQLDEKPPTDNSTTLWMNNIYAPLQSSSVITEIGARRVLEDTGGSSGMRAYNISVLPESSSLRVAVSPADGRARMGLYLYDCVTGSCKLWGSDVFTRPTEKSLVVPNPRAGLWRVVVDASAAGTAFKYTEIVAHPRFGSGTVAGENVARRTGARWNQKVRYEVKAPAPFGYDLVGLMDVIDPDSEADERAAPYSDWQVSGDARNQPLRPLRLTTQVVRLEP